MDEDYLQSLPQVVSNLLLRSDDAEEGLGLGAVVVGFCDDDVVCSGSEGASRGIIPMGGVEVGIVFSGICSK